MENQFLENHSDYRSQTGWENVANHSAKGCLIMRAEPGTTGQPSKWVFKPG